MLKYVASALLASVAMASAAPAFAQDRAPFTGPRVEALVGYDSVRAGNEDAGDDSVDGLTYGVGAGFDFDLGGVVLGIEGEYAESEGSQEFGQTINGTAFLGSIDVGRDIYVGGRIGVPVTPRTLLYAKAGYTNTTIDSTFTSAANAVDFDASVDGYRLGAGVEQMLGRNLYLKAEYRYSNYNGLRFDDTLFGNEDVDIDLDRHQVMGGLGFRF